MFSEAAHRRNKFSTIMLREIEAYGGSARCPICCNTSMIIRITGGKLLGVRYCKKCAIIFREDRGTSMTEIEWTEFQPRGDKNGNDR